MLFVPSIKGVSHHWTEDTSEADIVLGCQALADAAEEIAARHLIEPLATRAQCYATQ
jgi:beta-ureidopropionase / N-carbamoyl-L-amino-acid hydrolase